MCDLQAIPFILENQVQGLMSFVFPEIQRDEYVLKFQAAGGRQSRLPMYGMT